VAVTAAARVDCAAATSHPIAPLLALRCGSAARGVGFGRRCALLRRGAVVGSRL
jgi:hypothetical protein